MELHETALTQSLLKGNEQAFEQVFKTHFKGLYSYACTILKNEAQAEETVQHIFFKIWEKKETLQVQTSIKAYLYKAVYHESLNYLKHQKVKSTYHTHVMQTSKASATDPAAKKVLLKELEERLRKALNELPQQCRTVFQLSRFEGLKYQQIADELNISVKTVENQMGKALKLLRLKLVEFLPVIILALLKF